MLYIFILIILIIIVSLYSLLAFRFVQKGSGKHSLIPYFILGVIVGIVCGFIVFYNPDDTEGLLFFKGPFGWWLSVTISIIILGGLSILYIYTKIKKK